MFGELEDLGEAPTARRRVVSWAGWGDDELAAGSRGEKDPLQRRE
jgi:hypothetical protein